MKRLIKKQALLNGSVLNGLGQISYEDFNKVYESVSKYPVLEIGFDSESTSDPAYYQFIIKLDMTKSGLKYNGLVSIMEDYDGNGAESKIKPAIVKFIRDNVATSESLREYIIWLIQENDLHEDNEELQNIVLNDPTCIEDYKYMTEDGDEYAGEAMEDIWDEIFYRNAEALFVKYPNVFEKVLGGYNNFGFGAGYLIGQF